MKRTATTWDNQDSAKFCGFLPFPSTSSGFMRLSAKSCASQNAVLHMSRTRTSQRQPAKNNEFGSFCPLCVCHILGNGRNTVSRKLFRRRELTEPHWVSGQTRWVPRKNSVSSLWQCLSGTSVWRTESRYTMSRIECRIKFPQNQRCRAKIALHPPKSRCCTFLWTPPPLHLPLIRSRQGAGGGGVSRQAGGGYRGTFGFWKRIALQGGVAATVTPVALLCATKFGTQIIGWEELTEFSLGSLRAKKLTELGVSNRALRNRIWPVSDIYFPPISEGVFRINSWNWQISSWELTL